MNEKDWLKKHYPVPASEVHTPLGAAKHSLNKWNGCWPEVLEKYGMYMYCHEIFTNDDNPILLNGSTTCALCHVSKNNRLGCKIIDCSRCPGYIANRQTCDVPFTYTSSGDLSLMIKWLENTVEYLGNKKNETH